MSKAFDSLKIIQLDGGSNMINLRGASELRNSNYEIPLLFVFAIPFCEFTKVILL